MSVKSGSFEPAGSNAILSYEQVTFPDCCPDKTATPALRPVTPPPQPAPPCQSGCVDAAFVSKIENAIVKAIEQPFSTQETEEISVLGNRGIWTNREEVNEWKGEIPITEYKINEDPDPTIIRRKYQTDLVYEQELAVRYLRPPQPPAPGEIIIQHEPNFLIPPAPPLVIRQVPPRSCTPEPLVVREIPPPMPQPIGQKIITISGKGLPPPPRKVIIERLPPVPAKPQGVILERWLPFEAQKRRVLYRPPQPDPVYCKPKNVIVQWDPPNVRIEQTVKYLGIVNANPTEYIRRYGETLVSVQQFPEIVRNIRHEETLAADVTQTTQVYELEGDLHALKLIDLEREGLAEYKAQLEGRSSALSSRSGANVTFSSVSALLSSATSTNSSSAVEGATEDVNQPCSASQ